MNFWTRASIKLRLLTPKFFFGPLFSDFLLDHIKPHIYFDRWHIQPFNGQAQRMSTISKICRDFSPNVGIETGTYLGSSTPYLAAMVSEEMYTIEIDPSVGARADERFKKNHPNSQIHLQIGDSISEIVKILGKVDPKSKRVVAYLDAHWYEAVPTTKEINSNLKQPLHGILTNGNNKNNINNVMYYDDSYIIRMNGCQVFNSEEEAFNKFHGYIPAIIVDDDDDDG